MADERMVPNGTYSRSDERPILVVARGALGDVLTALPFIASLPDHFGAAEVTLVGTPAVVRLLAHLPFVNATRDQNQAEWAGLHVLPPDITDSFRKFLTSHRAAAVLSSRTDDPLAEGLRALDFCPVLVAPSRPPEGLRRHVLDHLFAATGVKPTIARDLLPTDPAHEPHARKILTGRGLDGRPWLFLHPGSGGAGKNWPLGKWIRLAERIDREWKILPVFLLGPAEPHLAEDLARAGGPDGPPVEIVNDCPLPVVLGLVKHCRAYVGHDSGVTHLAALAGCPTLAIFGPTDPLVWAPRGPRALYVTGDPAAWPDWTWPTVGDVLEHLANCLATPRE